MSWNKRCFPDSETQRLPLIYDIYGIQGIE